MAVRRARIDLEVLAGRLSRPLFEDGARSRYEKIRGQIDVPPTLRIYGVARADLDVLRLENGARADVQPTQATTAFYWTRSLFTHRLRPQAAARGRSRGPFTRDHRVARQDPRTTAARDAGCAAGRR